VKMNLFSLMRVVCLSRMYLDILNDIKTYLLKIIELKMENYTRREIKFSLF